MSEKVYVLTTGHYSDYGIEGIFKRKEDAEQAAKLFTRTYDHPTIEEWDLIDTMTERFRHPVWSITENHEGIDAYRDTPTLWDDNEIGVVFHNTNEHGIWYRVPIAAPSEEAAIKAGADKIAQYKAERSGIA